LRFLLTALIAGESLLLFLPQLPPWEVRVGVWISIFITLALIVYLKFGTNYFLSPRATFITQLTAGAIAAGFIGFSWATYLTEQRLASVLCKELEGVDVLVTGVVDSLPGWGDQGVRFTLKVESIEFENNQSEVCSNQFPKRLSLGWYAGWKGQHALPEIKPGQRWRVPVQLKRPHGLMNPHGFDFERWMFQHNLGANGSVRAQAKGLLKSWKPLLLDDFVIGFGAFVELSRWHLRERIKNFSPAGGDYVGVLIALVMGDQNAIPQDDWRVFNATGIGHLISISGLHVTMLAGLGAALANRLWRRRDWPLICPAQKVAALSGFLVALIYTWLAGFQVPAQRTMYMVGILAVAMWTGRVTRSFDVWWWALFIVVFLDPWAVYTPGFWLSFGAVAAILFAMPEEKGLSEYALSKKQPIKASLKESARVQAVVTIALLPLTLYWFSQASVISPIANALAIPLVSFVVTPFAMLGAILPNPLNAGSLWVAHACMELVGWVLKPLAGLSWSVAGAAKPNFIYLLLSTVGVVICIRPGRIIKTYRSRLLGLLCCVPLFFSKDISSLVLGSDIKQGDYRATVFDIGQGTAVLVETARHRLLYDTGPKTSPQSDAGERNLLPFLRGEGITFIDRLAISHKDTDHVGGALSLMKGVQFGDLMGTLPEWHFLISRADELKMPALPCRAGQEWIWDGVLFKVWHPDSEMSFASSLHLGKPNAMSCVIEVIGQGYSFWLTGDVEKGGEASIAREYVLADDVKSILLMPHHGSNTSSTSVFIDAIQPSWAIVQAGYRNRYRHPTTRVMQRYVEREIPTLETIHTGAQIWNFKKDGMNMNFWRKQQKRVWHHQP
jgi:competence protein ComEC